jgi:hypothetical protein
VLRVTSAPKWRSGLGMRFASLRLATKGPAQRTKTPGSSVRDRHGQGSLSSPDSSRRGDRSERGPRRGQSLGEPGRAAAPRRRAPAGTRTRIAERDGRNPSRWSRAVAPVVAREIFAVHRQWGRHLLLVGGRVAAGAAPGERRAPVSRDSSIESSRNLSRDHVLTFSTLPSALTFSTRTFRCSPTAQGTMAFSTMSSWPVSMSRRV